MKTNHTPGPWQKQDSKTPFGRPVLQFEIVAGIRHVANVRVYEPCDAANARLIASCPELLSALEAIANIPDSISNAEARQFARAEAKASLAKAKGEA